MFTSNARQSAARQSAETAKHEAADAFVALDDTQKSVSMAFEAFAGLEANAQGRRLLQELAPLSAAADTAHTAWIDTLDRHGTVLYDDDADVRTLQAAESAFRNAKSTLDAARAQLEALAARHADVEARVQAAWAQVSPKTAAAEQALADARAAVAALAEAGIHSPTLDARLARAVQLTRPVQEGPHRHGVSATLRHCAEAQAASDAVIADAQQMRTLADDTRRRLASTRTRLDAVTGRLEQAAPTLSSLRRRFSAGCSADLDHVPAQARNAVDIARRLLAQASSSAQTGHWEAAATALNECREHIGEAETGVNAVVQRLRDLDAIASDPRVEKNSTRFVVRDAQALVVSAGSRVGATEARVLDGLVARLDEVDAKLEGNHPDYWGYLAELRSIRELANGVVRRTRAALAGNR